MPYDGQTGVTMYGASWCGDCRRSKSVLDRLGVEYAYDQQGNGRTQAINISGRRNIPCILFPDGSHLTEPSDGMLETKIKELGLARR